MKKSLIKFDEMGEILNNLNNVFLLIKTKYRYVFCPFCKKFYYYKEEDGVEEDKCDCNFLMLSERVLRDTENIKIRCENNVVSGYDDDAERESFIEIQKIKSFTIIRKNNQVQEYFIFDES